ncbi:FHA domain-containing protein [Planctomycetota bacterium]
MHVNLVLFKKDGTLKPYPLSSNVTVIGRRHDCDLRIPLVPVSRRHCKLSKNDKSVKIHDLESANGTFINGKRVTEAKLKPGDYIKIGPLIFALQVDGKPEEVPPPGKINKSRSKKPEEITQPEQKKQQQELKSEQKAEEEITLTESSGSFADIDLSDSFISELESL